MRSSQIYAQICSTRTKITNTENRIKELEQLYRNQDSCIQRYSSQKMKYTGQLETQNKIFTRLSAHAETCVLAKRYNEHMSGDMSSTKRSETYDQIDEIERLMKSERGETQADINAKNSELSSLKSTLRRLEAEYQSALRAEEAERRAAAAAAQS